MYFFALNKSIFFFVKQADWSECTVSFNDKKVFQISRIPQLYTLFCKAAVYFILCLVNGDHAVSRDFPLDLKKKAVPNLFLRESVEQVWFREISEVRLQPCYL